MRRAWRRFLLLSLVTAACLIAGVSALIYQAMEPPTSGSPPGGAVIGAAFMTFLFIGLPLQIVGYVDLVRAARGLPFPEKRAHRLGLLALSAPVFLGGVVAALVGAALCAWSVWLRLSDDNSSTLGVRIGVVILTFGVAMIGVATKRNSQRAKLARDDEA